MSGNSFYNLLVCPKTKTKLLLSEDGKTLVNSDSKEPLEFEVKEILDLVYPKELLEKDLKEQIAYNAAFERYDYGVSWVFETLRCDEDKTRNQIISKLNLSPGQIVLEIGAGTGKDSTLIVDQISPGGYAILSDLSAPMLNKAKEKLKNKKDVKIDYFIGNASYLPFEDNTFDVLFHFGGINTFAERKKAFQEFNRVVKVGGKVVVGDESVAPWLRDQESYKELMDANDMFSENIPLEDLPKNIECVQLEWFFGNAFYVISFIKSENIPSVNTTLPIPNKDFVDNWKLRAEKNNQKQSV